VTAAQLAEMLQGLKSRSANAVAAADSGDGIKLDSLRFG
jgi:hypothetical protein